MRGGVELGGEKDGRFNTTGSRWGIQGSSEVSEGLTAVYKFETRVGSGGSASQGTNQLYAGLSGGFGSLTLGKFHNAAYNAAGAIRDIGYWYSSGDTASKVGNTVSYAFSSDAANFQVDAIMDSAKNSGRAIDEVQFGVSVNLGEIGKVALGYENVEDWDESKTVTTYALKSGKVTSDFSGEFSVPSGTVSGGIDAELGLTYVQMYSLPKVNLGECYLDGARQSAPNTKSECDALTGTTKVWNMVDGLTRDDTTGNYALTESYSAMGVGITGLPANHDGINIKSGDMTVHSTVISVPVGSFDGSDISTLPTPAIVNNEWTTCTTGQCVEMRVFYTMDEDGNKTAVDRTDGAHPGSAAMAITLNDGTLTSGSTDPISDNRTIDSNVDDLTVEANPAGTKTTPMHGYKATHVSVQLNLGAMTLGLGYSEKESNKMGSMDQKTTFVGASGSIGDTGMGWRAWTRDISNVDNAKGDANPWGIGINKDLGGGAFTFVEHHDADGSASGNTIVALGVNF